MSVPCTHTRVMRIWPKGQGNPRLYCPDCGFARELTDEETKTAIKEIKES
jgi:hypothetical protein